MSHHSVCPLLAETTLSVLCVWMEEVLVNTGENGHMHRYKGLDLASCEPYQPAPDLLRCQGRSQGQSWWKWGQTHSSPKCLIAFPMNSLP